MFTSLQPVCSLNRPRRPFLVGVLQPMSLPPSSAPTATGWSDSCRAGFAPAEEWRLARRTRPRLLDRDIEIYPYVYSELAKVARSARFLRFLEDYCRHDADIYSTFTLGSLENRIYDIQRSCSNSHLVAVKIGFLELCESHSREITDCLTVAHLPKEDLDVMRAMGSANPEMELQALVHIARASLERCSRESSNELGVTVRLERAVHQVEEAAREFRKYVETQKDKEQEEKSKDVPRKNRRWFKGFGQIGQGAALSIANAGLAVGALGFPVSPETQTWGTLVSMATGVGLVLNGVGDLRGE